MIPYILHVSILIAAGVLFYRLALKRLTFYVLNRWVLLGCLVAAFLLPLAPMPRMLSWTAKEIVKPETAPKQEAVVVAETPAKRETVARPAQVEKTIVKPERAPKQEAVAVVETIAKPAAAARQSTAVKPATTIQPRHSTVSDAASDAAVRLLFYLYLSGVVILGLNLLRQMVLLLLQRYKGPVIRDGHYRIVTRAGMQGPCSFGNIIFIHPCEYDPETYQQILLHEKIHAGGWHTLDILLAELGIIFQWFNPFIWLFRRELENNLEFLTDRKVLRHPGVERLAYQLSLVKVAAPDMSLNITSNYNQSLLKRRIIMMNAQNSSRHTAWKYFFLLPLFMVLAGVLNRPAALAQTVKEQPSAPAKPGKPSAASKPAAATSPTVTVAPAQVVAVQTTPDMEPVQIPLVVADAQGVLHGTVVSVVTPTMETNVHTAVTSSVNVAVPVASSVAVTKDTSGPSWVDRTEGAWFIVSNQDKKDDKVMIELRGENEDHNWNSSFSVPRSQLTSLN
ncbi:MAG TPA: M56 family metallopeptidase, partial [Puia sp.]